MANLDFEKLKSKLRSLKGLNNRSQILFKPEAGRNVIRIVPWAQDPTYPFIELKFHYLGKKTYLSPTSFGRPDPIVEFAAKLQATGNREDWIQGKKFEPKIRTFAPIVVRGKESEGVKFWSFGKQVHEQLVAVLTDPDWGDITDPKVGKDINLDYTPQEKSPTNFAQSEVLVKPNSTPLATEADLLNKLLKDQPDIYAAYEEPSYEALRLALEVYLTPAEEGAPSAEAAAPTAEASTPASAEAPSAPSAVEAPPVSVVAAQSNAKVKAATDDFSALFS